MAPTLSFNWWAVRRYHWIVLAGNRPSSRRVMIRLTGLTPSRCRPAATPCSGSWGSRRFRHNGHVRAMKTCSVTSTGAAGISMTSRVRCTHPPVRVVWHSGQDSGAWTTRLVGSVRVRAKPWGRVLRGFFSCSAGFLRPGIPASGPPPDSRASRPSARFPIWAMVSCCSAMTPRCSAITASRVSRLTCFRSNSGPIVLLCHNCAPTAGVFIRTAAFGKFTSSTLNCYSSQRP